jgi:hypothetical protein
VLRIFEYFSAKKVSKALVICFSQYSTLVYASLGQHLTRAENQ